MPMFCKVLLKEKRKKWWSIYSNRLYECMGSRIHEENELWFISDPKL